MPKGKAKLDWQFAQSFGTDGFCEEDVFTAVEFDGIGKHIALGDRAGRITIFQAVDPSEQHRATDAHKAETAPGFEPVEYKFYTEFQSHTREFDRLHSVEIEESINKIRWWNAPTKGAFLLSTNDTTIKFWKITEKAAKRPVVRQVRRGSVPESGSEIVVPKAGRTGQSNPEAVCKREYKNGHGQCHIESLSPNSDGETFLSADPLKINMWHIERPTDCYNICNLKPDTMEELSEVITTASFHPVHCSLLLYGTSEGACRVADLRDSALIQKAAKAYQEKRPDSPFAETTISVSDARFTTDGLTFVSRDYLKTKLWDVRMEKRPVQVLQVHDYLEDYLGALHQNECIFDKFECAVSPDGTHVVTGSYDSNFVIMNHRLKAMETIHATSQPAKKKHKKLFSFSRQPDKEKKERVAKMDFAKKALHLCWHPKMDAVAISSLNKVYIYQATQG